MKFLIYALRDPVTGEYRYIGKSSSGMRRPKKHAELARNGERGHKANWIRSLQAIGRRYEIVVLEEVIESELNARETFWITFYKPFGLLTNISDGGLNEGDQRAGGRLGGTASWAKLTPQQRSERAKKTSAGLTFEQRSRLSSARQMALSVEQRKANARRMHECITPEIRKEIGAKTRARAPLTKESRQRRACERFANMTPEERKKWDDRGRVNMRAAHETNSKLTPEQLTERGRRGGKTGAGGRGRAASMTPEQRSELGRLAARAKKEKYTPEQHSEMARKRCAAMTFEQLSDKSKKAWATRRAKQLPRVRINLLGGIACVS